MPFNLIGASEAAPGTGTVNVAFPQDDRVIRVDNGDAIKVPAHLKYLYGVLYAAESTGARLLLAQPSRSNKAFLKCALTADVDPVQGFEDYFRAPIALSVDKLEALSVNATDEDTIVGLMLGNGMRANNPPTIDEIIDGYSDTTITANTWHPCPVTWNQDLKEGKYSIVGMRASVFLAANPWTSLVRVVVPNPQWKPGVPATIAEADHEEFQSQSYEPYSVWGDMGLTFKAPEEMPNIEVLSPSAITDENIQLMLKKVG